jgi:hypothetical protein
MIYQKRGHWCFRDDNGKLHKFATEAEAKAAYGIEDGPKEKVYTYFEEEKEDSFEQEALLESEDSSEEEV